MKKEIVLSHNLIEFRAILLASLRARAKSSPGFVHKSDSDDPEIQSDSQATVLSRSLTSEETGTLLRRYSLP